MTHTNETIDYAARVARGASLLDRVRPGWAGAIDLATLNLRNCRRCVLGQLWGDFCHGVVAIEHSYGPFSTLDHGFDAEFDHGARDNPPLNAAWRAEIRKRMESVS